MALPILDGNQSATTLSTILSGGEHTPAHTVVSLGSTAISNITSAVSGSVVSISNFPASQSTTFGAVSGSVSILNFPASQSVTFGQASVTFSAVTISNLPATQTIAGTVTAQTDLDSGTGQPCVVLGYGTPGGTSRVNYNNPFPVQIQNNTGQISSGNPFPVSGTVTLGAGTAQIGSVTASISNSVTIGNNITLWGIGAGGLASSVLDFGGIPVYPRDNQGENAPFPISGTVTANVPITTIGDGIGSYVSDYGNFPISGTVTVGAMPNGSLTTRFGTPTTASVAFATTAVTNANRKYLLIQNVTTGSNVITVGIGFTPTTTQGIQLTAGAGITFESSYIPTGAVYVLSSVTASNFTVLEA
jgi:hypothetical protein